MSNAELPSSGSSVSRRLVLGSILVGSAAPVDAAVKTGGAEESSRALDTAISGRDAATMDRLIAPDLIWIRGGGVRGGKSDFIAALAAPDLVIEPFTPRDVRWLMSGDLAILTAINELRGTEKGETFVDRHHFCDTWRRDGTGWRLVYAQVTRIP